MALSEAGGGLSLAPQVSSSQLCAVLGNSGFGVDLVDQRQEEGNLELVFFSTEEGKVGNKTEAISVGSQVENCLWEGTGDKMGFGSSFNGVVAEEGAHLECSLNLLELIPEGLLLLDKLRDGKGELERNESMVITPLVVEGEDGQRVSPSWVVERIKRFFVQLLGYLVVVSRTDCWLCLRRLKLPDTALWQNLRLIICLHKG